MTRDDLMETMKELQLGSGDGVFGRLTSQQKSAFTRAYNKAAGKLQQGSHYSQLKAQKGKVQGVKRSVYTKSGDDLGGAGAGAGADGLDLGAFTVKQKKKGGRKRKAPAKKGKGKKKAKKKKSRGAP